MPPARARPVSLTIGRGAWPAGSWLQYQRRTLVRGHLSGTRTLVRVGDCGSLVDCAESMSGTVHAIESDMTTRTLYRAADTDYVADVCHFATDRESAEVYMNNGSFGGKRLWQTKVTVDEDQVLDLRHDCYDRQVQALLDAIEGRHEACGEFLGQLLNWPEITEALAARGYRWVRFYDDYPDDCETWAWVGAGPEPELIEVAS